MHLHTPAQLQIEKLVSKEREASRDEEIAQWFRALVLMEDPGSIPAPMWLVANIHDSSSRESEHFPGLYGPRHIHGSQMYMWAKHSYMYVLKINKYRRKG